ncbi:uncharacterized protein N7473_001688 [Penicillium subrubescens]|uniref:uncharacterized protein n=1 Tax=Penicillium subrubescens TaxID=1316194 RepID=UPI0025454417|nr:uncharacterized protein N7473_001688 [Penicillium subrubescens]KAJ5904772.1 hypothetical protein N7473_001688 [Penicillium subrubescens]
MTFHAPVWGADENPSFVILDINGWYWVTGIKSRYVPMDSWEDFGRGIPELGEHRLLFAFTLATGGRYYGDIPTTTKNSAVLKKAASEAKENLGPDAKLLPLIHWFRVKFGNSTVR